MYLCFVERPRRPSLPECHIICISEFLCCSNNLSVVFLAKNAPVVIHVRFGCNQAGMILKEVTKFSCP